MLNPLRSSSLRRNAGAWAALAVVVAWFGVSFWVDSAYPRAPSPAREKTNFERYQDSKLLSLVMVPVHVLTLGQTLPLADELAQCRAELLKAGDKGPTPKCADTTPSVAR